MNPKSPQPIFASICKVMTAQPNLIIPYWTIQYPWIQKTAVILNSGFSGISFKLKFLRINLWLMLD